MTKLILPVVILVIVFHSISFGELNELPSLGDIVPANLIDSTDNRMLLANSAQFYMYYEISIDSINYAVAFNKQNIIKYIGTSDSLFTSIEGLQIGDSLVTAMMRATESELYMEPGWGYFLRLESGWFAGFFTGETATEYEPVDDTPIKWFFKR